MTMHSDRHPDDLRLSALAAGDADAAADRALTGHVAACDRCGPLVRELMLLRGALAAMPDLVPSRPLRLIPPVEDRAADRAAPLGWLRRLAAPAMALGAGLVLIGAVGASGVVGQFASNSARYSAEAGASDTSAANAPGDRASHQPGPVAGGASASSTPARALDSSGEYTPRTPAASPLASRAPANSTPSPKATAEAGKSTDFGFPQGPSEQPWMTLLIAGVALLVVGTVLRFSLIPRAG